MNTLVSRSSTGKIRVAEMDYEWNNDEKAFVIHRTTYQYKGKHTEQPDKKITCGKAGRTLTEQCKLEYAHLLKEYKDKGYKELEKSIDEYSESELNDIIGSEITGQDGVPKPMLAKQADKVTNPKVFDKEYYVSRKIDGLRCLIYLGKDGKPHTASRKGMNYDAAMSDILEHPMLIKLLQKNPTLILDGECFKFGKTLQEINSVARTQVTAVDYEVLQFYWYDLVDTSRTFTERWDRMQAIADALGIYWDPEREFSDGDLRIQLVPQEEITGWNNIKEKHNQFVSEGWEGAVIRLKTAYYKPNGRSNDMIKVKQYQSGEFIITGYELGLRGSEDMVFNCETEDGKPFKAKPHGDRSQKQWYIDNFDSECLGKYAVVKYFYYSEDGVPLQPSVSSIRLEEDMPNG